MDPAQVTPRPAASDFTGDLKSDVLWRHATRGDVWLWPMDGAARTAETYVRTVADTNWEIRGLGDQDGDGKADILWRNKVTGQIYFWPMNGSAPDAEIYVGTVDPAYDIVGTGDFDGDGKSDILWRHTTMGDVWIWLMDGATPLSRCTSTRGSGVRGQGRRAISMATARPTSCGTTRRRAKCGCGRWTGRRGFGVVGGDGAGRGLPDPGRGGLHRRRQGRPPVVACDARRGVDLDDERRGARGGDLGRRPCPTPTTASSAPATTTVTARPTSCGTTRRAAKCGCGR